MASVFSRLLFVRTSLVLVLACLTLGKTELALAQKYYPDHPAVQEMVNRGIDYLSKSPLRQQGESSTEGIGLLAAYTVFKVTTDPAHPVVANGIQIARGLAAAVNRSNFQPEEKILYVISLAGMLLPTVDPVAYGAETGYIRDFLLRIQKPNGGYGYLGGMHRADGDISQTQYAMLCLWTMGQQGIQVPDESIVRSINFLLVSQAQDGGWPYQYGEGASGAPTNSLTAAGLSGLLIAGDMLGMFRSKLAENQEEEGIIPLAFKRIMPESKRPRVNIERAKFDVAATKSETWFAANPYSRTGKMWHYYFVYSKERYESFLEITKGKQQKSPDWYNQGVETLKAAQAANGSWGSKEGDTDTVSPDVCTCFSVLFLIRSTQKAIGELHEANIEGVGEIPDDVTNINLSGNKIVNKNTTTSIDDALKMLEADGKADGEDALSADRMLLSSDPKTRKEQLNRFSRLLSAKDYKSRRLAAKMLGRGDDIDMVPGLIYALTDPDPEVPIIAERSLRLVSRQLDTAHLPKKEKLSDQEKARAAIQWKKWFANVRPDYIFVD